MVGIVGYGAYAPRFRIKVEEIAEVWGEEPDRIKKGLKVNEKSVPGLDEDAATMAVEASKTALSRAGIDPQDIGAVYVGSESHPYAVKPTSTILAEAMKITPYLMAVDMQFACKAGTAGIQAAMGLVKAGMIKYGLAVGSDTAQGRPGDVLEYTAGAGAGAYLLGPDEESLAIIKDTVSFCTDTPDFWRRSKSDYPRHGGRFTGEPAYFKHMLGGIKEILRRNSMEPGDFDYYAFHQPNGKFPRVLAKKLGIDTEKVVKGLFVDRIGNTYAAGTPMSLALVLDQAEPGDKVLVSSFGSGAGTDTFILEITEKIKEKRPKGRTLEEYISKKTYLSYGKYIKHRRKLKGM